ncbi:hypothetical protein LTR64_008014 [Lithohypha guttulata]|uniref:uncharacterized protein n=1 Tax=Lithohypha guttulata TaxID=1690604 RepID=UPI002DE13389|nr:hypothetical protein LTR51_008117 [Lithohypha guttulata]
MSTDSHSPQAGLKRAYAPDDGAAEPNAPASSPPTNAANATSAFRNVSACNRCRVRKNRCDQQLPACSACTKANVRCVGYDPITKREIPRSYVYFLETRLNYFETLLKEHNVTYDSATVFDADSKQLGNPPTHAPARRTGHGTKDRSQSTDVESTREKQEDEKLNRLVSNIGMVSVQGTSDSRYLGSTSGISFARVVLSAVKKASPAGSGDKSGSKLNKSVAATGTKGSSMRDSYFGLQTKPQIKEAPFPNRELGERLATLYFEHANPQIPILHREEFSDMFEKAYSVDASSRTPQQLYILNIVYAIGAGIIWGSSDNEGGTSGYSTKRARLDNQQAQPEEYHASAIVHLSAFLSANGASNEEGGGGDLEELQAVLLLAGFALLRPVAPGLWYIVGVAMRQAIDLGLHYEDGSGLNNVGPALQGFDDPSSARAQLVGKRQWIRDLRRRLWWCTYTFDRLVSTCVGRPFGITDQVITTEFPSALDDRYITRSGISVDAASTEPSYKRVSYHYFRLRLLQSEILQVLQYEQAQMARMKGWNRHNDYMHKNLPSPFLVKHKSFKSWRRDIDQRLFEWKESAPTQAETGVAFSHQFLELNYWQAVTMLYRQSLSVPPPFASELSPTEDVTSPSSVMTEDKEDEDLVFLKCAEAGQKTLKLYRQLHRQRLVNYTYLATHHLFMAGIAFLYAVWHSPAVRSRITLDDFDFTVLAATSVLGDLMTKCPPAEACRDAFERMSKVTYQICISASGFGFGTTEQPGRLQAEPTISKQGAFTQHSSSPLNSRPAMRPLAKRPPPKFDMDLRDLFPEGLHSTSRTNTPPQRQRSNARRNARPTGASLHRKTSHPQAPPLTSIPCQDTTMSDTDESGMQNSMATFQGPYEVYAGAQQDLQEPSFSMDPSSNSYNPDFMSNLPGLEFLGNLDQDLSRNVSNLGMAQSAGQSLIDPNLDGAWLDIGLSGSADGDAESEWGLGSGLGVGVGMGLDFGPQHDWSNGQGGYDLFDGFFFSGDDGGGGGTGTSTR